LGKSFKKREWEIRMFKMEKNPMISEKILNWFTGKNILITGGSGMIGRQVTSILAQTGASLRIVSLDKVEINHDVEFIFGDLTDSAFCREITKDMDIVFHIAGIGASVHAAKNKIASHFVPMLMMNCNVLEACRINKVEKIVYTSSVGAYAPAEVFRESEYRLDSNPMDFAGWAKRMAEEQIRAYHVEYGLNNFSIVRPSNVYGPGDNFDPSNALVIPALMYRIYHGENPLVVWGDGTAIRDFVHSKDVAKGIVLALYHGTNSRCVNLGYGGNGVTIRELVETLATVIDFEYVFDPSKPRGALKRVMDITVARETLKYDPLIKLKEGLQTTWDWFTENPGDHELKNNYFVQEKNND
jgi:GDP-L-fucose synthase